MTVVLLHGTFDLLHYGHLCLFKGARRYGSKLVVTVTADAYVKKGPGRPIYTEYERAEMIRALRCVDHVEIVRDRTGIPAIEKWKPAFYAKGADYRVADKHGNLGIEQQAVESVGGKLVYIETPQWSSSNLIERISKWKKDNESARARTSHRA